MGNCGPSSHAIGAMQAGGQMSDDTGSRREKRQQSLREIGSIVLGVLIALGLGVVATEIGWRVDAKAARGSLSDELGEAAGQAQSRVFANDCVEQRLDIIASILDDGERSGRLPPIGQFDGPQWFTWDSNVWQSVIASGTAPHFQVDEQSGYGGAYAFVAHLDASNNAELRDWAPLFVIVGPGRPIAVDELARLRAALAQARQASRQVGLQSVRLLQVLDVWQLPFDRTLTPTRDETLAKARICQPIPTWSNERYGSGPWRGVVQRAIDNPITRNRR